MAPLQASLTLGVAPPPHSPQVTVLYDLEQYAEKCEAKSPRAAIVSPRRSPRKSFGVPSSAADFPAKALTYPDGLSAPGLEVGAPQDDIAGSPLSAQLKYLNKNEAAVAEAEAPSQNDADELDPLVNPDARFRWNPVT